MFEKMMNKLYNMPMGRSFAILMAADVALIVFIVVVNVMN